MPCTYCNVSFNILKWKNKCNACSALFCSDCISNKRCLACRSVLSASLQYDMLMKVKVKDLKLYSTTRGLPISTCKEKTELVNMILLNAYKNGSRIPSRPVNNVNASQQSSGPRTQHSRPHSYVPYPTQPPHTREPRVQPTVSSSPVTTQESQDNIPPNIPGPPDYTTTQRAFPTAEQFLGNRQSENTQAASGQTEEAKNSNTEPTEEEVSVKDEDVENPEKVERPTPTGLNNKLLISDISSSLQIDLLTSRELKQILTDNFVNYKGCVEKSELHQRVVNLYQDRSKNQARQTEETENEGNEAAEDSTCRICWDRPIDCVLLECGHMVTCTTCGKQMNECPICRQFVVRCVHVFRT